MTDNSAVTDAECEVECDKNISCKAYNWNSGICYLIQDGTWPNGGDGEFGKNGYCFAKNVLTNDGKTVYNW